MQDDSRRIDPEHPVMRMLGAFFEAAVECGPPETRSPKSPRQRSMNVIRAGRSLSR